MARSRFDVIVVGGGPAGSACAAFCARAGLSTLLLERAVFPREKVCGDCLNPGCWEILDRLEVAERVLAQPHARLTGVEFIGIGGRSSRHPLREIAIKRSLFDDILLRRAIEWGADVRQDAAVTAVESAWKVTAREEVFESPVLVAADGRNSTVAKLAGLLPAAARERIAVQTHLATPARYENRVALRFLPWGYCGMNDVGGGRFNLCMVGGASQTASLKQWAGETFPLSPEQVWRTIAPLSRKPVDCSPRNGLFLVGDAARVMEPFTGEGIFYALASGELAARCIIRRAFADYKRGHAALYGGRLWINRLAKEAVTHPRIGSVALALPGVMRFLTARVVGSPKNST